MSDLSRQITFTYRDLVQAPPSVVWSFLMEAIRNPAICVPAARDVAIFNEGDRYLERTWKLGDVMQRHDVTSWDPNVMTIMHRDHASLRGSSGFFLITLLPDPAQQNEFAGGQDKATNEGDTCFLDFTLAMTAKPAMPAEAVEGCRQHMPEMIVESHHIVKQQAEARHFDTCNTAKMGVETLSEQARSAKVALASG
jgi:hypothetical protein